MTPGVYAAFLRGINVGGNRKVPMVDLRQLFEGLGYTGVRTLLQSGNVVFGLPVERNGVDRERLAAEIEDAIEKRFGFGVPVVLRTPGELQAIAGNPFLTEARRSEPGKTLVYFLEAAPEDHRAAALLAEHRGPEEQHLEGSNLLVFYPQGLGKSRYDNSVIDRALGTAATGRNLNTLLKTLALAEG